jgi:tetratricopeptide (TPR) repeat protein
MNTELKDILERARGKMHSGATREDYTVAAGLLSTVVNTLNALLPPRPELKRIIEDYLAKQDVSQNRLAAVINRRDLIEALELRAFCLREIGQQALAIEDYREILDFCPGEFRWLRLIGESQSEMGEFVAAVKTFTRVIEQDSQDIFAREIRARALRRLERIHEAEVDEAAVKEYHDREKAKWGDPNHYYNFK